MLIVSWMAGTGMLTLAQGMPVLYALNVEIDIKTMRIEAGITQVQLANMLGITPAYVNRIIRQKETVINRTFTKLIEALGYDIQIIYVKPDSDTSSAFGPKGRSN